MALVQGGALVVDEGLQGEGAEDGGELGWWLGWLVGRRGEDISA